MPVKYVKYLDTNNNVLNIGVGDYTKLQGRIGTVKSGGVVDQVVDGTPNSILEDFRRQRRDYVFAQTIDKMNTIWYNTLTDTQKETLADWRSEWLDYPATNTMPTVDVTEMFGEFDVVEE